MTLPDFFLLCFLVGFLFSLVSFLTGHFHIHLVHGGAHGVGHGAGHGMHTGGHAHGHVHTGGQGHTPSAKLPVPWINGGTIAAFLIWFGGSGYLATHVYGMIVLTAIGIAIVCGIAGASIVFLFLAKVLMNCEEHLDPADYEMVGVLGKVSCTIRAAGTGEILFSQAGVRKASSARSESGQPIPIGIEVVVTKFENGIAYVRRWDELAGDLEEEKVS
jgi:membrane protein implicated in regulation of membrane protease activity